MRKMASIHCLRRFAVVNLNRDDLGNPKTVMIEGVPRTTISPQCQAFHQRAALWGSDDGGIERTRYNYHHYVFLPLIEAGIPEEVAREMMYVVADVISGRNAVTESKKRDKETKLTTTITKTTKEIELLQSKPVDDKQQADLKTKQARLSKAETDLKKLLAETPETQAAALTAKDRRTAEVQVIEKERLLFLTAKTLVVAQTIVKTPGWTLADIPKMVETAYDKEKWAEEADKLTPPIGAIMGNKGIGNFQPTRDGAVYKSFAIAVNRQQIDEDYWSATDKYEAMYGKKGSLGSAHLNTSKYATDTFYLQEKIDLDGAGKILRTKSNDERIVGALQDTVEFFLDGSIGAKKTSTNPDSYSADVIIVEFHDDNGCSLLNYQPSPDGVDSVEWAARFWQEKMTEQDRLRDRKVERAVYSTVKGVFGKTMTKGELIAWVADQMGITTTAAKMGKSMAYDHAGLYPTNGVTTNGKS